VGRGGHPISEAKCALKDKKITTQINGKFSVDENK
jgi:hypothetical protein